MAFIRTKGPDQETSILVAEQDGTANEFVTTRQPSAFPNLSWGIWATNRPAWSPDGKRLMVVGSAASQATESLVSARRLGRDYWCGGSNPLRSEQPATGKPRGSTTHTCCSTAAPASTPSPAYGRSISQRHVDPDYARLRAVSRDQPYDRPTRGGSDQDGKTKRHLARERLWRRRHPSRPLRHRRCCIPSRGLGGRDRLRGVHRKRSVNAISVGARRGEANVLGEGGVGGFAATPDGRFVVFSSSSESPLYRVNSDGSG